MSQRSSQTKKHISEASESSGVSYQGSEMCVDGYLKSVKSCLLSGEAIFLPHIGTIRESLEFVPLRAIKNKKR